MSTGDIAVVVVAVPTRQNLSLRHAQKLQHVAIDVSARLARRPEVQGIAVTGSVARGDCVAGSDVDLWVIGPHSGRETFAYRGTSVTYLWQPADTLKHLDTLMLFEIEDAWIVYDPQTLLRGLRKYYLQRRDEVRAFMLQATAHVMHDLALQAQQPSDDVAVAALRELGRRAAAMAIYLKFGWRAPHYRHFAQHLSVQQLSTLNRVLALPDVDEWRYLLSFYRRHTQELLALQTSTEDYPPPLPSLAKLKQMGRTQRREDAWQALRTSLQDVPIQGVDGPARQLWSLCQGFRQRPANAKQRQKLATQVATLIRRLGIEAHVDKHWQLRQRVLDIAAT